MTWFDVTWFDVTWFDMTWFDVTWFDVTWFDVTWFDVTWFDVTCLKNCAELAWWQLSDVSCRVPLAQHVQCTRDAVLSSFRRQNTAHCKCCDQ